jgi:hypothetical protein
MKLFHDPDLIGQGVLDAERLNNLRLEKIEKKP